MTTVWERGVDCVDPSGRDRELVVSVTDDGHLSVTAPPPGTAIMPVTVGDSLKAAVAQAQRVAAELALGIHPLPSSDAFPLEVFSVLDLQEITRRFAVGADGSRVSVAGPARWQASPDVAVKIGTEIGRLGRGILNDRRR
jgi:hypothetical protein